MSKIDTMTDDMWVRVEDRLPDDDYVLLYSRGDIIVGNYDDVAEVMRDVDGYPRDNVTHWMPLPEPPETEKADE